MDQRTRKLMTMHKALHPRDDIDRLCVSRKEGGRGLASIEDCGLCCPGWPQNKTERMWKEG